MFQCINLQSSMHISPPEEGEYGEFYGGYLELVRDEADIHSALERQLEVVHLLKNLTPETPSGFLRIVCFESRGPTRLRYPGSTRTASWRMQISTSDPHPVSQTN
jgi:hypothetical protein